MIGAAHVLTRQVLRLIEGTALSLSVQQSTQLCRRRTILTDYLQLNLAVDEAARGVAGEVRAHASHRALALRLLCHTLLRVCIEVLRVLAHIGLRRRDLLNDALRERMLSRRLASSM